MKILSLFLSVCLMTVTANGQRNVASRSTQDFTAELKAVQNIIYQGAKHSSERQELTVILQTEFSTRKPLRTYAINIDSVTFLSLKDTLTLYKSQADTACHMFEFRNGYCNWIFTFSLQDSQRQFFRTKEVDTVLFFEGKKFRSEKLTAKKKSTLMDIVKQ